MPWFNVDDGFANSKPVLRIPRRYRCQAIGLWTLAGSWSAKELTDGYIPDHALEEFASTPYVAAHLVKCGLWTEVPGGWQFEGWSKWQKTKQQVLSFRSAEAERKRAARSGKKPAGSGGVSGVDSARTEPGVPSGLQPESEQPLPTPLPIPNLVTSVEEATETYGAGISATRGADLVREIVPREHPSATLTTLRIQASELLKADTDVDIVRAALQLWCDKPGVGNGRTILSSLCSEVIKSRTTTSPRSSGGLTAGESKVAGWAAIGQPQNPNQRAINP